MPKLTIHTCGPRTLVQDLGRIGHRASGVGESGAADRASFTLANRLVGNDEGAAAIECLLGGLTASTDTPVALAVTGADAPITVDGVPHAHASTIWLHPGQTLRLGIASRGLLTYLAVRGGIAVAPVLGSCSTDTLSGIGPAPLTAGDHLPIGVPSHALPPIDLAPVPRIATGLIRLSAKRGPRDDWFTQPEALADGTWRVSTDSNRIGVRLDRSDPAFPMLTRARIGELRTEPVARGSIQIPPSGQPVIFLADHPVTGGYPVVGVLRDDDIDRAAQLRPGQHVCFRFH